MKRMIQSLLSISFLFLSACAPTTSQLKEAVQKDPSIVFAAIEKDPQKFMEVVNTAARAAQQKQQDQSAEDEVAAREAEFKNPLKPEINESRAILGNKSAKVTIVEYTDFECPYCQRGANTVKEILKAYPNDVRVLVKHFPLDFHPKALPAARYYEALAMQSHAVAAKFHDAVFENQNDLKSKGEAFLKTAAKKAGGDMLLLTKNLKSATIDQTIQADIAEAQKFGMSGTPGFVINGVTLKGAYPFPAFKQIIDRHLAK